MTDGWDRLGWMCGWMGGRVGLFLVEKNILLANISKTTDHFFLIVFAPLRRVFKHFLSINSEKNQILFFSKNFLNVFFQFFFEVCGGGDLLHFFRGPIKLCFGRNFSNLVDFLEVCSSGVFDF